MSKKEKKQVSKLMTEFHKHGGGTEIEEEFTTKDPNALREGLQKSFDNIFPELMKKSKQRKHIIFDADVFETYYSLSQINSVPFSALINSTLRNFAKEKMLGADEHDLISELFLLRKKERQLMEQIKESCLEDELSVSKLIEELKQISNESEMNDLKVGS